MTGNKVLLDTNIVIGLSKGDKSVIKLLKKQHSVFIPVSVLAELYLGAYRSKHTNKHLQQIKEFLSYCQVLNADNATAEHYAIIKANLFKKGRPIPENDIWIAATAIQHSLSLYTNDSHFKEVDDLIFA